MPAPKPNTPIPRAVRDIASKVHRRYAAACNRGERPALDDPQSVPLTALERAALARSGYYPIPCFVIRHGMTRAEYQRQNTLDAIAAQLPDAVVAILEATRR